MATFELKQTIENKVRKPEFNKAFNKALNKKEPSALFYLGN